MLERGCPTLLHAADDVGRVHLDAETAAGFWQREKFRLAEIHRRAVPTNLAIETTRTPTLSAVLTLPRG